MRKGPHPVRFFFLVLPFGVAFGYIATALQYVATHHRDAKLDLSPETFAGVLASAYLLHTWKPLWAPVVDSTLSKRLWYLLALILAMAGIVTLAAMPVDPQHVRLLTAVVMASQLPLTFLGMSCEAMLGNLPAEEKATAAGWYQAGNFLGLGLGGGLALDLATRLPQPWIAGAALAAMMAPCALALIGMPEPQRHAESVSAAVRQLSRDVVGLVTTRIDGRWMLSMVGIAGLVIAISPVSAGAAGGLMTSAADTWHASKGMVEFFQGWASGPISAAGALLGGWLSSRMDRRVAYALAGAAMALTGVFMAFAPFAPWVFAVGAVAYGIFVGVAYACFCAFVLETIGGGSVATKYNLFASLANGAISYMLLIDGAALTRWGARGLMLTDAGCTFAGILLVLALVGVLRKLGGRAAEPVAVSST